MPKYVETMAVHAAFNSFNGFSDTSGILAWLRGWQIVTSKISVPPLLPGARKAIGKLLFRASYE